MFKISASISQYSLFSSTEIINSYFTLQKSLGMSNNNSCKITARKSMEWDFYKAIEYKLIEVLCQGAHSVVTLRPDIVVDTLCIVDTFCQGKMSLQLNTTAHMSSLDCVSQSVEVTAVEK